MLYSINTIRDKRCLLQAPAIMAATTPLREALNRGISSGNLIDTKIVVYSHRDTSGRVCRPKALYANSHVLKIVPYFNDCECTATLDITRVELHRTVLKVLFGNFSESQSRDFKEAIDDEESAEDYGYSSDSDLEDDEDERITSIKRKARSKAHPFNPFATLGGDKRIISEENEERVEKGKVVKIPDMAFVTWVRVRNHFSILLTPSQIPSFLDVSLYGCDRVRTIWIRRESQIT